MNLRFTIAILTSVQWCLRAAEEPLAPTVINVGTEENRTYAALTPEGWIEDRVWHQMSAFYKGLSAVQESKDGKWSVMYMIGNLVVPLEYNTVSDYCKVLLVLAVKKGQTITVPGTVVTFKFRMSAPFGNEILMAVASSVPFTDQAGEDVQTQLFQEFKDTDLEDLAHRGISVDEIKALTGCALHLYRVKKRVDVPPQSMPPRKVDFHI